MQIDIVDWIKNAGGAADSHTIAFPHSGTDACIHSMKGNVSEFGGRCRGRCLESGFIAEQFARIGVKDSGGGLVRMKRSPTNAGYADFREGRSLGERRRARRKDSIDAEIVPPIFGRDFETPADENGIRAGGVDEQLALDAQRPIDDERSDRSGFIALDETFLRLVYFD